MKKLGLIGGTGYGSTLVKKNSFGKFYYLNLPKLLNNIVFWQFCICKSAKTFFAIISTLLLPYLRLPGVLQRFCRRL